MEQYGKFKVIDLLKLILRYWWILLISVVLCTFSSYYISAKFMTPVYKAESKMFVGREKDALSSLNLVDLQIGSQLVTDYSELIKTNTILEGVLKNLDLDMEIESLSKIIEIKTIEKSRFLNVIVKHPDPEIATELVNEISDVLKDKAEVIVGAKNIQIVDYATVPTEPDSPRPVRNSAIGFVLGLIIALLIIIVRYLLDNKIESREDLEAISNLSMLGEVPKSTVPGQSLLFYENVDDLNAAESYRLIRTNLHYLNKGNSKQVLLFTSALGGEGKTTTVANVAAAFALTDKKVLLIDCDMRKPKLNKIFKLKGNLGITNYISDDYNISDIIQKSKKIGNLSVMCSGPIPPNPAEIISSQKFAEMIEKVKRYYDVILIDTPPVLLATDGLNLANHVDGAVLITASRESKKQDFMRLKEFVQQVGYDIAGVIITKSKIKRNKYYN